MTTRPAFEFDPDRCTSCEACRIACGIENNEGRDTGWRTVMSFNAERVPDLPTRHLSLACNHCDTPACALGCPANAYRRDPVTGAVILDGDKCIGCRYCSWVCPYDAPKFNEEQHVMTKCTFCSPRVAAGGQPACTAACPTGALSFGSIETATGDGRDARRASGTLSAATQTGSEYRTHSVRPYIRIPGAASRPDPTYLAVGPTGLGPALKISTPKLATAPVIYPEPDREGLRALGASGQRKITVRSEWALLLFTLVMPALVAWFGGGTVRPERAPSLVAFLVIGGLAMLASMLHLGKPMRAWRAILNVRSSWLSREILFANLFMALAAVRLLIPTLPHAVSWLAIAAGIALVISIDGVYRAIPRRDATKLHSAEALPALALLIGIATGVNVVTWAAAAIKAVEFVLRKRRDAAAPLSIARLILLGASCALSWPVAFATALAGEAIDRAMFYDELEPTTPARRIADEMVRAVHTVSPARSSNETGIAFVERAG